ncbi:MAG: polyribonucleotide nucleotidyltransferase [Bdellovibrionales bacterium]|nr:polyribonucleotide nucleotidyltransferase [Bdellovibrionales bacterium]
MALNNPIKVSTEIGGRTLTLETGRFAKQAHGSVIVQYGETMALVTAVSSHEEKAGIDFLPLTIEFQEKFYASGKIPGGFFKREARPSDWATLNARMVDRPIRPLFPKGYRCETQIVVTLLSYDGENEVETIAGLGASAALMVSDIVFNTPIATVRVGRVKGQFLINPTNEQLMESDISVLVSGSKDAIMMVEGGGDDVAEEDFLNAIFFGFEQIQTLVKLQEEFVAKCGKAKRTFTPPVKNETLAAKVKELAQSGLKAAYEHRQKALRYAEIDKTETTVINQIVEQANLTDAAAIAKLTAEATGYFEDAKKQFARAITFSKGHRIDGRAYNEIRPIECEAGLLPRTHGSALFTRGETQALATVTLGTSEDEQLIDSVRGKFNKRVMLHYNFPPFCVGETGRFGGNSRREIGHSALAERAVVATVPTFEKFPYTIRIVSEVLESNGSSSMASVCGGSMALMDAGVPVNAAVAGIAMGLMKEGDKVVVLSDILGDEDHLGDMDFKVCGTKAGLNAVQMDIKMKGVSRDIMRTALLQAREGRLHILAQMEKAIAESRKDVSQYAPRITTIKISTDRIKDLIGPGGKNIKGIVAATGVKLDVEDSGKVNIASSDPKAVTRAIEMIRDLTEEPEIGRVYMGTVVRIQEYGAFVEIRPGVDGLCHVSELDHKRVQNVRDIIQEGDQIPVKVLEVDRQGKIRLSRKAALPVPGAPATQPQG